MLDGDEKYYLTRARIDERGFSVWSARIGARDDDAAMHLLLARAFSYEDLEARENLPKQKLSPFRKIGEELYGYSDVSASGLRESMLASPRRGELSRIISPDSIESAAMPVEWEEGSLVGFNWRTRPVRRVRKSERRMAKEDAFVVARRLASESGEKKKVAREDVYLDWARFTLAKTGAAELVCAEIEARSLLRSERDWMGMSYTSPDVTYKGVLRIVDSEGFARMVRRGVGKERGYGFGMLLLSPVK